MSTNTELFGIPYADITMVNTVGGGWMGSNIDAGSFADDGASPPVYWTATWGDGEMLSGGPLDKLVGVAGQNPAYVPPPDDSGND